MLEINVPEGARRLEIRTEPVDASHDIDLFVRYGLPPAVEDSRVLADHRSQNTTGVERIVIDAASQPPLRPGKYYVALGQFTFNVVTDVNVIATIDVAP